ncbi:MAG: DoxX family protein [Candidatus Eisenbacteria bacterium]|uniref:DoxX family protein n=1 Tax=Eiseniibacteriota bacterium TaxID=2212470 RepID=A0A538T441_UNCEI|nr:MAG: DoxX family protein [Candidatus Eisenbacteria bacterium]
MKSIFSTTATNWQLPLRLALFLVFWMHGAQKVLGMYHGPGLQGFAGYVASMGMPSFLGYVAAFTEFLGAFSMLLGFLTRFFALGLAINMLVAIVTTHWKWGFFLNWMGEAGRGHGYEYPLTLLLVSLALLIGGAGNLSIDRMIAGKRTPAA